MTIHDVQTAVTMQDASLPADMRNWVSDRLGDLSVVTDMSWSRSGSVVRSRVWRVSAGHNAAYVKVSASGGDYDREVHGYGFAARALAVHQAPRLLAVDADLRAVMTAELPGQTVRGLPLAVDEGHRLHESAGRLLRRWHNHSEPVTAEQRQAILASVAAPGRRGHGLLERTAGSLTIGQRELVQRVCSEPPELAEDLPLVYRHGDYNTRNWMWHPDHGHACTTSSRLLPASPSRSWCGSRRRCGPTVWT